HEHAAASLSWVVAPGWPVGGIPRTILDGKPIEDGNLDGADRARGNDLERARDLAEEQEVVHYRQRRAGLLSRAHHGPRVSRRRRQGLLAENVAPTGERGDDEVAMKVLRGAHIDDVDVGPVEELARVRVAI